MTSKTVEESSVGVPRRAVVLWSGGVDSTTCLYMYLRDGWTVHPIFFDYHHKAVSEELACVQRMSSFIRFRDSNGMLSPLFVGQLQSLHYQDVPLPGHFLTGGLAVSYAEGYRPAIVPMRNTVFSTIAYYYARLWGASRVVIGSHIAASDGLVNFPDCDPSWLPLMQAMYDHENVSCGVGEPRVSIDAPIINMRKQEIVAMARELGVTAHTTWGCYFPVAGKPCGRCEVCLLRKEVGLDE